MYNRNVYLAALKNLECTEFSTKEEIKFSYRKLCKTYHPDINKHSNIQDFRNIQESYDYLLKYHTPKESPIDDSKYEKYFRVLPQKTPLGHFVLTLPFKIIDRDIIVHCLYDTLEFKVRLKKETQLPYRIRVTNITKYPIEIEFHIEKGYK